MARLIDEFMKNDSKNLSEVVGEGWFIAKPVPYTSWTWGSFKSKCKEVWGVISGRGFVCYYKEDEKFWRKAK